MYDTKITLPENFNWLPDLLIDYLNVREKVSEFVHYFNTPKDWNNILSDKEFTEENRKVLVQNLKEQYSRFFIHQATKQNIDLLNQSNTYTVTTGHQLCLLTGPLFFIYKIVTTIKLAEDLKLKYPDKNFVPFYWLASEDHDFAEINHTYLFGKKISWDIEGKGPVGKISTTEIKLFTKQIVDILGSSENAVNLVKLIEKYHQEPNIADATIALVNELFGSYGLVCLDANTKSLKKLFIPTFEKELLDKFSDELVSNTNGILKSKGYNPIVESKTINLFYLDKNVRERIEFEEPFFKVRNTDLKFSKDEIISLLKTNPEKFSPNVVLRPLYQETILPNLAYIGGPSEIAYWMQFKKVFEAINLKMPVLVYRKSFFLIQKSMYSKWLEMGWEIDDIKKDEKELTEGYLDKQKLIPISFETQLNQLVLVLEEIKNETALIDKSLLSSINAEEQKFKNALLVIQSKLNKANRSKFEKQLSVIKKIKEKLFPMGIPQERVENIFQYFVKYPGIIDFVMQNIDLNSSNSSLLCLDDGNSNY